MAANFAFRIKNPFNTECRNFGDYMHEAMKQCLGKTLCSLNISSAEASNVTRALISDRGRLQLLRLSEKCGSRSKTRDVVSEAVSIIGFKMCFRVSSGNALASGIISRIENIIDGEDEGRATGDECRSGRPRRRRETATRRHPRSINITTTEPPTEESSDFRRFRSNSTSSEELCQNATMRADLGPNATAVCSECGNGVVEGTSEGLESCDDGNNVTGDGCASNCTIEIGYDCSSEEKERSVCYRQVCGDGVRVAGEDCDAGGGPGCDNATCVALVGFDCSTPVYNLSTCVSVCGDGLVVGNETCDDGNGANDDGCSSSCAIETGYNCSSLSNGTSVCLLKDGFGCSGGGCFLCGNGFREFPEQCDDGNVGDLDGCNGTCHREKLFNCEAPFGERTSCDRYQIDFDAKDNATLDHTIYYTRQKEFVYIVDPELIEASRVGAGVS